MQVGADKCRFVCSECWFESPSSCSYSWPRFASHAGRPAFKCRSLQIGGGHQRPLEKAHRRQRLGMVSRNFSASSRQLLSSSFFCLNSVNSGNAWHNCHSSITARMAGQADARADSVQGRSTGFGWVTSWQRQKNVFGHAKPRKSLFDAMVGYSLTRAIEKFENIGEIFWAVEVEENASIRGKPMPSLHFKRSKRISTSKSPLTTRIMRGCRA